MSFRKLSKRASIQHPLRVIKYNKAYALLDSDRRIVAGGLSKAVAEELLESFVLLDEAIKHLQKILVVDGDTTKSMQVIKAAMKYLKRLHALPKMPSNIIDLSKLQRLSELL